MAAGSLRREFLLNTGLGFGSLALSAMLQREVAGSQSAGALAPLAPDIHATVLHQLGLDPRHLEVPGRKRLERDFGSPIHEIIA